MAQFKILTMNKISKVGLDRFSDRYECGDAIENPDGIMVRSASLHEYDMPESLLAIARAGAGVNNIPVEQCAEKGIVVFNTPGANANAVKELVIAGLFLASRKVAAGIEWAKTLKGNGAEVGKMAEKGKGSFVGPEVMGKTLGVIGLGAIGGKVANAAHELGMEVIGYDPYLSLDAAWGLSSSVRHASSLKEVFAESDYITIHIPATAETKGSFNAEAFGQMKDGVRILNFSRAELVKSEDMLAALESGKVASYVVDFPTDEMIGVENVTVIPHLGASTPESEDNCAVMAADELKQYLKYGTIKNSVNFPNLECGAVEGSRICIFHRNIPTLLTQLSGVLSDAGINIENMLSKSKKDYAYTVLDFNGDVTDDMKAKLSAVEGVLRVRVITK